MRLCGGRLPGRPRGLEGKLQLLLQRGLPRRDRGRPRTSTGHDRLTTQPRATPPSRGEWYEATVARRLAAGEDVFAPARRVAQLGARSVLDAGCGSGHLARFFASLCIEVVAFDIDPEMLEVARSRAPEITWLRADITTIDLGRSFDAVLVAGNVLNFVAPDRIAIAVHRMASHLDRGGRLWAGFSHEGRFTVADYERWVTDAGLTLEGLASDWKGTRLEVESPDVVACHRAGTSPAARFTRPWEAQS